MQTAHKHANEVRDGHAAAVASVDGTALTPDGEMDVMHTLAVLVGGETGVDGLIIPLRRC